MPAQDFRFVGYLDAVWSHWRSVLVTWLGLAGLLVGTSLTDLAEWPVWTWVLVIVLGLFVAQYQAYRQLHKEMGGIREARVEAQAEIQRMLQSVKWALQVDHKQTRVFMDGVIVIVLSIRNTSRQHPMTVELENLEAVLDGQSPRPITLARGTLQPEREIHLEFTFVGTDFSKAMLECHVELSMIYRHAEDSEFRFRYKSGFTMGLASPADESPGVNRMIAGIKSTHDTEVSEILPA